MTIIRREFDNLIILCFVTISPTGGQGNMLVGMVSLAVKCSKHKAVRQDKIFFIFSENFFIRSGAVLMIKQKGLLTGRQIQLALFLGLFLSPLLQPTALPA